MPTRAENDPVTSFSAALVRAEADVAAPTLLWTAFAEEVSKFGTTEQSAAGLVLQESQVGPQYTFAFGPDQLRHVLVLKTAASLTEGYDPGPVTGLPQWLLDEVYETIGVSDGHDGQFVLLGLEGDMKYSVVADRFVEPPARPSQLPPGSKGKWFDSDGNPFR